MVKKSKRVGTFAYVSGLCSPRQGDAGGTVAMLTPTGRSLGSGDRRGHHHYMRDGTLGYFTCVNWCYFLIPEGAGEACRRVGGSAYWRIGVWGSKTDCRYGYNDQEVCTKLMMLCKRRHADTPIRFPKSAAEKMR